MAKRIAAIIFIFVCTSICWAILGSTIFVRTYEADSTLKGSVVSTWGAPQQQSPPSADYLENYNRVEESLVDGKKVKITKVESRTITIPLDATEIQVSLALEHRQKGLLWYSTYKVDFLGDYSFRNDSGCDRPVTFRFSFPAERAIYDGLQFSVNGAPVSFVTSGTQAIATTPVPHGEVARFRVQYRSQGLDRWRYKLGGEVAQARNFSLNMTTDFHGINFPDNTLSPTTKQPTTSGWRLSWAYSNLFSGFDIGMDMPEKLQPGPLAGRISYFAPVSLFFFFFLMFIITTMRRIDLHPMNYFFLAAAFFSFHLLLAYLADHTSIHLAFAISSFVSIFLVVSYLRLVVGMRFAAFEAVLSQLIYLVLFSYAFFFEGFTGLAVTIGSVITLFVVMQITGRIRWSETFAPNPPRPTSSIHSPA